MIAPSRKRRKEKKDVDRYKTNNRRYNKSWSKEKREESKKKKNVIDIERMTLFASNVVKMDTLVNIATFKER